MTNPIYELALMGAPTDDQVAALVGEIEPAVSAFGLRLGVDVGLNIRPLTFAPSNRTSAAAAFFGSQVASGMDVSLLLSRSIPVLPVVSSLTRVRAELPAQLWPINCLEYGAGGASRVASALLECAGLGRRRAAGSSCRDQRNRCRPSATDEAIQISPLPGERQLKFVEVDALGTRLLRRLQARRRGHHAGSRQRDGRIQRARIPRLVPHRPKGHVQRWKPGCLRRRARRALDNAQEVR